MSRSLSLVLILGFLVQLAGAQLNALIVISPEAPKPAIDPAFAGHFETVLWPTSFNGGSNRMLTLMSGIDWIGEPTDASFHPAPGGRGFVAAYFDSLARRGYFEQRSKWLNGEPVFALSRPVGVGDANPDALLLALGGDSNEVRPIAYNGPWPDRGLIVFEADSWTEAEDVASRCGGRALILQIPDTPNRTWDSFYPRGRGWPLIAPGALPLDPSTGVAGLIRARNALTFLLHPNQFKWRDGPDAREVVWRWFPDVRQGGLFLLVAGMTLFACIIGFATYSIMLEERAPLAATLLLSAGLAPAALMVLGLFERYFGLQGVAGFFIVVALLLAVALVSLHGLFRSIFPGAHPLLACSVIGVVACVAGNETWSYLSGLFGYSTSSLSPEATGSLIAYLTAVVAFTRNSTVAARWFGRAVVLAVLLLGLFANGWWGGNAWLAVLLPLVALASGEGWMRWPWLFILAFVPNGRTDVVRHGFAWSPLGCLGEASQLNSVNVFDFFAFLVYPGLWAMGLILLYVSVFGGHFVASQMRLIVRLDPRMKALPWAAASLAAMSAFYPALLPSSVFVAFGALITFFHTAVWSL